MTIEYNLIGNERKELVKTISEIIGAPAKYQYMPTCAYKIGRDYTVTKEGNLEISDAADSKVTEQLISELDSRGYHSPLAETEETHKLSVEMPTDFFTEQTYINLRQITENKAEIFKAAFKTDTLEIVETEKTVEFPWFTIEQNGDSDAYCTFVSMLCTFAKNQKRVNQKQDAADNSKYAMRCFLLRLGMIGNEYKATRKVLLRNLSGSSSFRHGGVSDAVSE